jgi:trans-aconitate methyltransferase
MQEAEHLEQKSNIRPTLSNSRSALKKLDFLDFGCGVGGSMGFASSVVSGRGLGIDISQSAIKTARTKGFDADVGNILEYNASNAATCTFAINVMQEMPGYTDFERACVNAVRAARNFAAFQHPYFDQDSALALKGYYKAESFSRKISFKPNIADYLMFTHRYAAALNVVGFAAFVWGDVEALPLIPSGNSNHDLTTVAPLYKSLRIIIARKEKSRFRGALEKLGVGKSIILWERS